MGSSHSKPDKKGKKANKAKKQGTGSLVIGAPQDVTIHVPRNRLDRYAVAVIVVGGAVNILHLRSRATTHDVDVFGSDFDTQARLLLDEAMHNAQQAFPGLGTDWLNTETQLWMPGPMHKHLTTAARNQNVVVFNGARLAIYAAPWEHAFPAKVSRLLKGGDQVRSYDLADAVTYIHQYIHLHGNRAIPVATVLDWARQYNHQTDKHFLRNRVDAEYQKQHGGRHAIV